MAKCVEELKVYQKALAASTQISALIRHDGFRSDLRLREQLGSASERVASSISEGFEQSSDRFFAQYCYRAKGSCAEIRTQLTIARDREHIIETERDRLDKLYEEIARMLSGLIDYLEREDRKKRRAAK
jgi:four helix bundle protein